MQMLSARYGVSLAGLTMAGLKCTGSFSDGRLVLVPVLAIARRCFAPGPWQFSQPIGNSEKGVLSKRPFVPATGFGRPLWQKMHPGVMGRLKPKSVNSYPGEGAHFMGRV